ncbi:hypothetical protein [Mucilaginibacter jinjuensis]|uniref:PLAT domain-containing protein n=1 Tax=Mucilaginibacter jinjuensis TaxID=1176721 RepID=A0ABY7T4U5_9SPHI|nr:hypothetical protein [Mucilaginibacter jinjuensis]WCT10808.1 hypothetical protein PQO05_18905 [Mucilaginibacter jinjuensis]
MHTDTQIFKEADGTVDLLFSLEDYDFEKTVDVMVSLKEDGENKNYTAVYTKKRVDGKPEWVPTSIRK